MDLTNATIDEIISLELAIAIAYEKVKDCEMTDHESNLIRWAERARQAKVDITYEQDRAFIFNTHRNVEG